MYQPHNVHLLSDAIHDDYRRACRRPTAWAEASTTWGRPRWQRGRQAMVTWFANLRPTTVRDRQPLREPLVARTSVEG